MSSDIKQGWEPSDAVLNAYYAAKMRGWSLPGISPEECDRMALRAAVAADPLLSAAKDMQDALAIIANWPVTDPKNQDAVNMAIVADAALAKSRGE